MQTMVQVQTDSEYDWIDWDCVTDVSWVTHSRALIRLANGRVINARNIPAYLLARELENQGISRVVPCSWYREAKEDEPEEDPGQ
jgi:hypothetical protein